MWLQDAFQEASEAPKLQGHFFFKLYIFSNNLSVLWYLPQMLDVQCPVWGFIKHFSKDQLHILLKRLLHSLKKPLEVDDTAGSHLNFNFQWTLQAPLTSCIGRLGAWIWKTLSQPWPSQACCLGSDCQFNNLLVIGPQNVGRLPVATALTVSVHLISLEFTRTEVVCCYLQPELQSESVPSHTWLSSGRGHYVTHYWNTFLTVTITG